MDIKPEELLYKLKNNQPLPEAAQGARVWVIFGEEDYYRMQLLSAAQEYLYNGVDEADREITAFEKDTDLRQLSAAINTYPFFCGQSLIILRDEKLWALGDSEAKKQQQEQLAKLLDDVPDYCTVLIGAVKLDKRTKLYKTLKKSSLMCECEGIRLQNIDSWLMAQANRLGGSLEGDAMGMIMEYLAPVDKVPLQLLQQELEKLAVYAGERKRWTRRDVETIFSALPEASRFALNNFIAKKDLTQVLTLLADERKKGTNVLPLCGLILFQLRQLLQVMELKRLGYDQKNIAAELKLHPYGVKLKLEQCRRFTEEALQTAVIEIAELNTGLRQGGRDYPRLEEILVKLLRA